MPITNLLTPMISTGQQFTEMDDLTAKERLQAEPRIPDLLHGYEPEDVGNAHRFIAMSRDFVRWCPEFRKWLVWDGCRWKIDGSDKVRLLAHMTMKQFGIQAVNAGSESLMKLAACCLRTSRITNALREAQPSLTIPPNKLDSDPWLLNLMNGTVNLQTGELLEHNPRGITSPS